MRITLRPVLLFTLMLATACRFSETQRTTFIRFVTTAILNSAAAEEPPSRVESLAKIKAPAAGAPSVKSAPASHESTCEKVQLASCGPARQKTTHGEAIESQQLPQRQIFIQLASLRPRPEKRTVQRICTEIALATQLHSAKIAHLTRIVGLHSSPRIAVTVPGESFSFAIDAVEIKTPPFPIEAGMTIGG